MYEIPEGNEFDGWSDGVRKYYAGNEFVMPEQNVTLTAQLKEIVKKEVRDEVASTVVAESDGQKIVVEQPEQVDGGMTPDGRPIIVNVYNTKSSTEKTVEKEIIHEKEESDDGLEFADYTILQLYELLTDEQKRYFDKLKDAALSKPQAKLTVGKSFFNL